MDYVSHGIWSYIIFNKIRRPFLAVIFGLLPDTMSWFIYAIYKIIITGTFGKPILSEIPNWVFMLYNISHSLFVAFGCIAIVWLILRKFPIYMLAWPIAITIDFLTHTREFLPTPFLWPVSEWRFPGIKWSSAWFMILNYALIAIFLTIIIIKKKKSKPHHEQ